MEHIRTTVFGTGAQVTYAAEEACDVPGMGSIARQPAFPPVSRREIMAAVNACGPALGLRPATLVVLDALLSCLPCQGEDGRERPVSPATLLTIYASNETLCFRAKGLTDRQLRRHLDTLERAGLLTRRDSANGKRFPVMRGGKVVGAFGLDLSPLFARTLQLLALAQKRREEAEELRGLKAQILRLRAACLERPLEGTLRDFLEGLRNLLRRSGFTLTEARAILERLGEIVTDRRPCPSPARSEAEVTVNAVAAVATKAETSTAPSVLVSREDGFPPARETIEPVEHAEQMTASDGQNVRHKEPESETKKRMDLAPGAAEWASLTEISAFYPEPASLFETTRIAYEFGRMLRISQGLLQAALEQIGLWELLKIEDQIAARITQLRSPEAYLRGCLTR